VTIQRSGAPPGQAGLRPQTPDPNLTRWRLILGDAARGALGGGAGGELSGDDLACDAALSWLYDREPGLADRDIQDRRGNLGPSQLTVPDWLNEVHRLFPKETIERLEQDAVERYQIHEVVTNPEVLARVEPNETLLKAVLRTKHLMSAEVLALARELVAKVVCKLMEKLARQVKRSFTGTRSRRRSPIKIARNFDAKGTIRQNLDTWDVKKRRLVIKRPLFFSRTRRHCEKWQVILLVDESGSMLSSVIHSAVTAACLWGLPAVRTHLAIFDTEVVDLTERVTDPVELLMKVQLGGGTDIGKAVAYGAGLVEAPRRAIVVLITDFYEGAPPDLLVQRVKALCDQGTIVLGLAALDEQANPAYDRDLARRLVQVGAHVGAMTPGELVNFIAEKVRA
jgi:Mg-chelatase subunit ChlD